MSIEEKAFEDHTRPCPVCNGTWFYPGTIWASGISHFQFSVEGRSFVQSLMSTGAGSVKARMCVSCKHLDLFVVDFNG